MLHNLSRLLEVGPAFRAPGRLPRGVSSPVALEEEEAASTAASIREESSSWDLYLLAALLCSSPFTERLLLHSLPFPASSARHLDRVESSLVVAVPRG